jgi:hypothetical protein
LSRQQLAQGASAGLICVWDAAEETHVTADNDYE